ncbi:carbamoyltransferase C-terminal domain-containing protein [Streptomyces sp. NPDC001056]
MTGDSPFLQPRALVTGGAGFLGAGPHMLFAHDAAVDRRTRTPAVVPVDGTARVQTAARDREPPVARVIDGVGRRTGPPLVVGTGLNTAGRPVVDDPRDALERSGSAPVDPLVPGPSAIRRAEGFA